LAVAITSPIFGSIFLTGEAAPWDPKNCSRARLKAALAFYRYPGGRFLRVRFLQKGVSVALLF
jgi:hypothetical protein